MLREVITIGTIRTRRDGLSYWQQTNKKLLCHNETGRWHDSQTRLSLCLNGKWASLNRDSEYFHYGKLLGPSRVKIFIWTQHRIRQGPLESLVD